MANDYSLPRGLSHGAYSAHRAVIYAAGLPGLGEMHARAWLQGGATLAAFLALLTWFGYLSWQCYLQVAAWQGQPLELPLWELAVAFGGMLSVWFWGLFNAARTTRLARIRSGLAPQHSPAWGALFSWFCPGCGQAYAGKVFFGGLLLLLHVCGLALMAPVYEELGQSLGRLLDEQSRALALNYFAILQALRNIFFTLENSLPAVFLEGTKMVAMAEAVQTLAGQRDAAAEFDFTDKPAWYQRIEARAAGLFLLGWFAPGAGQLLQGRGQGWFYLAAVLGCRFCISFLVRQEILIPELAADLLWIPELIRVVAMLEAPVRLFMGFRKPSEVGRGL